MQPKIKYLDENGEIVDENDNYSKNKNKNDSDTNNGNVRKKEPKKERKKADYAIHYWIAIVST